MPPHQELNKLRKEEISPYLSNALCQKYVDWHRQAKPKDGRSAAAARTPFAAAKADAFNWQKLEELADSGQVASKKKRVEFKAGTKLLREYQGKTHQVLTTSEGFLYEDTLYKSLTAIANKITGKKWNGRVFFKVHLSAQDVREERCLQPPVSEVSEHGK